MPSTSMWIETARLSKRFGGVLALDDVDVDFPAGSVTAIIGPNGAGKTTLFNVLAGFLKPDTGSIYLFDDGGSQTGIVKSDLAGLAPHVIARKGIGVLFQDVKVFKGLSARDNVAVGFRSQPGESVLRLFSGASKREDARIMARADQYLEYVGLLDKAHLWTSQLSYGQQKLVAIARLLAADARILLLDEPTSGVHPDMVEKLLSLVQRLAAEQGRAVVMIEHNLNTVRRIGDWVYLMVGGRVEIFGEPREVLRDQTVFQMFPTL